MVIDAVMTVHSPPPVRKRRLAKPGEVRLRKILRTATA